MISYFSNPARFESLARIIAPAAAGMFFLCAAAGIVTGIFLSPDDYQHGDTVRIMYVHVPAAWMAMASYSFIVLASFTAFVWRHTLADLLARSAALPGTVFTALALFTGAVWGKPAWGAYWVWDARLTSMLFQLFVFLGYMAVWQAVDSPAKAARFARILALLGAVNIPVIKFSVEWWHTLHQPASITLSGKTGIHADMLVPLFIMTAAYMALFVWVVLSDVRTALIIQRREKRMRRAPARAVTGTAETGRQPDPFHS